MSKLRGVSPPESMCCTGVNRAALGIDGEDRSVTVAHVHPVARVDEPAVALTRISEALLVP